MSKGINRLAKAIDARTAKQTETPSPLDFGTIGDDGSLRLDQFGPAIPKSDYLVAEWLVDAMLPAKSRVYRTASPVSSSGEDLPDTKYSTLARMDFAGSDESGHLPKTELRFSPALQPGDRVLVIWVRSEPVVISKVVSADA